MWLDWSSEVMTIFSKKMRLLFVFFLISFSLLSCIPSPSEQMAKEPKIPTVSSTNTPVVITETLTPEVPTETLSPMPPAYTETVLPTQTKTATRIPPSPTLTEEPPLASLFRSSVCRFGPGTIFPVHTYIKEDRTAIVRGRLDDNTWYLIELPENQEKCWIFNQIVELDKVVDSMPILTPPPKPTPAPAPTQSEEEKKLGVKYFLIIPDNGGPFACGDGLAYFYSGKNGKEIEDDITVALNALFSVKTEFVGNYYNPLYKSSLKVKDVEYENGHANIWLAGNFVKPISECEAQRIRLQVWETASQFSKIKQRPIIWVNNALLGDLLQAIQQ
jgi:hypothetical protein